MPVLDGVEATRQLERALAASLPIVAVSGHDYEERVLEIRQAGARRLRPQGAGAGRNSRASLAALLDPSRIGRDEAADAGGGA